VSENSLALGDIYEVDDVSQWQARWRNMRPRLNLYAGSFVSDPLPYHHTPHPSLQHAKEFALPWRLLRP